MRPGILPPAGALRSAALLACVAAVSAALAVGPARADAQAPADQFVVLAESAVFDPATGQVTFTLTFNRPPDFQTVDTFGRQADEFQYYIFGDQTLPYPAYFDSLIRGGEIHLTPGLLRVRNSVGHDPDPASGGFGTVRGVVPYRLDGNVMTFSASLGLISDHSTDGHFSYLLATAQYGALTQALQGQSVIRPAPPLPTSKDQCKNGGWRAFPGFKNQGDCVSYVATGGRNPPTKP
jgi:hypothetical protein